MKPVLVNPHHVKKSKEFDDNNPTKNDRKDPKVIAGLVRERRYMIPYLSGGVYADLRTALNMRFQLQADLQEFRIGSVVGSTYIFLNTRRYLDSLQKLDISADSITQKNYRSLQIGTGRKQFW